MKLPKEKIKDILKRHDGKIVSDEFMKSGSKIRWQCSKGHKWYTTPNTVKKGF